MKEGVGSERRQERKGDLGYGINDEDEEEISYSERSSKRKGGKRKQYLPNAPKPYSGSQSKEEEEEENYEYNEE